MVWRKVTEIVRYNNGKYQTSDIGVVGGGGVCLRGRGCYGGGEGGAGERVERADELSG